MDTYIQTQVDRYRQIDTRTCIDRQIYTETQRQTLVNRHSDTDTNVDKNRYTDTGTLI